MSFADDLLRAAELVSNTGALLIESHPFRVEVVALTSRLRDAADSHERELAQARDRALAWQEMASKMREVWCRRVHELNPPLSDEEIEWADEYVALKSPAQGATSTAPQERPLDTNGGHLTGHFGPQSECQLARGEAPRVPAAPAMSPRT